MISYRRLLSALLPCLCLLAQVRGSSQTLNASVALDQSGTTWNYTLTNNEPSSSGNQITTFYLPVGWSVSDVLAPADWDVNTDGSHFILWANVGDPANDIAPGTSLSGFSFNSDGPPGQVPYTLLSWDHITQSAGPPGSSLVVAPVPEAGGVGLLIGMGIGGLRFFSRRHRLALPWAVRRQYRIGSARWLDALR
jgi:hypothetical protein